MSYTTFHTPCSVCRTGVIADERLATIEVARYSAWLVFAPFPLFLQVFPRKAELTVARAGSQTADSRGFRSPLSGAHATP